MVKGRLPGQTGAIFHFRLYPRISGAGKGLNFYYNFTGLALPPKGSAIQEGGKGVLRPSGNHTPK